MQRRRFLKYTSLGTASLVFSGCKGFNFGNSPPETTTPLDPFPNPAVNFGNLEKSDLVLGFLPVMGATPLIIAQEKGFFQKYGLNVTLRRQLNWLEIETGLKEYRFDAAQTPYTMPIIAQFSDNYIPMSALMVLHRHGSSIVLDRTAWDTSLRPARDYFNFQEFAKDFRKYIREGDQPFAYGVDSLTSNNYYLFRYWLSTIGIRTKKEVEWVEISPPEITTNLEKRLINGYCSEAPWDQQGIFENQGFSASVSKNIWTGHPGSVLSTMIPWLKNHPTTARALTAAILEACQFCDLPEKRAEIGEIVAQNTYLNSDSNLTKRVLGETYQYGGFDEEIREDKITDFYVFHHQNQDYFGEKDHANYPWLSHGIWFLTQLIRWKSIKLQEYPKNADYQLKKVFPLEIYEEVTKALKIKIPGERMKIEPPNVFIDQREFDPSDPVKYLRQFPREL